MRALISAPALLLLAGCATPPLKSTERFLPLAADPRVLYEPGAEQAASEVATRLPAAIAQVAATHQRGFLREPQVHVCSSEACFRNHVTRTEVSAATVAGNRIFLAPQLFQREAHRLPLILAHELSHQHLGQQIGHYTYTVPVWFHEGLAALASNGGGADYASDAEARADIRAGRHFDPAQRDSETLRHLADHWRVSPYTFYRQAMLFLQYLRASSERRFDEFLLAVEDNQDFDLAFGNAYNMTLSEAGKRFAATQPSE